MLRKNEREIAFRARRISDGQMVYGQYTQFNHGAYIHENEYVKWNVDVNSKGQLIGITDKNNRKIYEGDILLIEYEAAYDCFVAVYKNCGFVARHLRSETYLPLNTVEAEVIDVPQNTDITKDLGSIKDKIRQLSETLQKDKGI